MQKIKYPVGSKLKRPNFPGEVEIGDITSGGLIAFITNECDEVIDYMTQKQLDKAGFKLVSSFENFPKYLVVWKDGSYKFYYHPLDAEYSQNDPDWLTTININNYQKKLDEQGYTLVSSPRWVPEEDEVYYTIDSCGDFDFRSWGDYPVFDKFRLKSDNVFKTKEECQKKIDEINSREI